MSMQQARIVAVPFVPQTPRVGASQIRSVSVSGLFISG
jgi:hypothetical protein